MRLIVFTLAASVVVLSSPPDYPAAVSANTSTRPARGFFYYHQYAVPMMNPFYNQVPVSSFYPYPYTPGSVQSSLDHLSESQRSQPEMDVVQAEIPTIVPSIDQSFSEDDREALKQLQILKEIYTQNEASGVILPSIIPMPRGFLLLKASALASLLTRFSITSANIVKTKTVFYPTFG